MASDARPGEGRFPPRGGGNSVPFQERTHTWQQISLVMVSKMTWNQGSLGVRGPLPSMLLSSHTCQSHRRFRPEAIAVEKERREKNKVTETTSRTRLVIGYGGRGRWSLKKAYRVAEGHLTPRSISEGQGVFQTFSLLQI